LSFVLVVAACSSAGAADPTVSDPWVRPPMGADRPAAGYLTITGGEEADALIAAASPVATTVEIHETAPDASGMMAMHPVDRIDVAAGATVNLEPGGYHLMLMGVTEMPAVGETVEITLTFEQAGEVKVQAEVRAG
jgi:periplasmic copper chaperone A